MRELTAEDQAAIQRLFQQYGEAWGRRDEAACAALFVPEGDLLALDGELCTGPSEIEGYYSRQLSGPYKDFTITDVALSTARAIATDVAVMNASWQVHGFRSKTGGQLPVRVRASFLMRREGTNWRFIAARFMVPFTQGTA